MFRVGRFLILIIVFAVLAIIQAIGAMYPFKEELSCDLSTGFYQEILLLTFIIFVPYLLVHLLLTKIKVLKAFYPVQYGLVVLLWFLQDLSVFESRVACWSTFTTSEAANYTLRYSFIPILLATVVFVFLNKKLQKHAAV